MLLGIVGMYALGKSTWMYNTMDEWPNLCPVDLICVRADDSYEYHYNKRKDVWNLVDDRNYLWKKSREQKVKHLQHMIECMDELWVVDSARYFIGCQEEIVASCKKVYGGIRFVVSYASPRVCRAFVMQRCKDRNKTYNAAYWDDKRLMYESKQRYWNVMHNNYMPHHIPVEFVEIDAERKNWSKASAIVAKWIEEAPDGWYK
jgi:hypothetical protein